MIITMLTPLAIEKTLWSREGKINRVAYAAEIYEDGEFVCSGEVVFKDGKPVGVITAKHCILPNSEYRVEYLEDKEIHLKSEDFQCLVSDIVFAPIKQGWKPEYRSVDNVRSGSVDIYHTVLGKTVKVKGDILFIGKVGDLRIAPMLYWLDPEDKIMLVKAISFPGVSGSPVYFKGKRVGLVSGGGQGMTIVVLGK
ncbi:MAG: hypothetical protein QXZ11_00220 [Thermoproteota archaeon]